MIADQGSAPLDKEHESSAIKPARFSLRRAISIVLLVAAALFVTTVVFRTMNPISPIRVAEVFGAPKIKGAWVPLAKMSPDLPLAVIASEDGRFCNGGWIGQRSGMPSRKVEELLPDCAAPALLWRLRSPQFGLD
jgi:monofunctional biosynthetic peptidoglycan transglycosylase